MLHNMRKSDLVLYLEDQDSYMLRRKETLLTIGHTAVLNFNLFPSQQSKSQLLTAWVHAHICSLSYNNTERITL